MDALQFGSWNLLAKVRFETAGHIGGLQGPLTAASSKRGDRYLVARRNANIYRELPSIAIGMHDRPAKKISHESFVCMAALRALHVTDSLRFPPSTPTQTH